MKLLRRTRLLGVRRIACDEQAIAATHLEFEPCEGRGVDSYVRSDNAREEPRHAS